MIHWEVLKVIDEGLLPHHPPILVTIDKVSQGEITHYSSDKVHYLGHERWIEHLGHFCSVNSLSLIHI